MGGRKVLPLHPQATARNLLLVIMQKNTVFSTITVSFSFPTSPQKEPVL